MTPQENIFDQMSKIERVAQSLPAIKNGTPLDKKIAAHRVWLQNIQRERPSPAKQYKIGVYIRYFNQTRHKDYIDYHKKQFEDTISLCPN